MLHSLKISRQKVIVEIIGKLSYEDYQTFRQIVEEILSIEKAQCSFDLKNLDFLDSAGLGMFLFAKERIEANGGKLLLINPKDHIFKLLELGGFGEIFQIRNDS
jgi:anti-anti-sigma factor